MNPRFSVGANRGRDVRRVACAAACDPQAPRQAAPGSVPRPATPGRSRAQRWRLVPKPLPFVNGTDRQKCVPLFSPDVSRDRDAPGASVVSITSADRRDPPRLVSASRAGKVMFRSLKAGGSWL